jgi:uncharacterized protein (TIGR02300 family)
MAIACPSFGPAGAWHAARHRQGDASLAKAEWGLKRTCQSCGTRFYDMQRSPIVCPHCSAVYDAEAVLKTRRGRVVAAPVEKKPVKDDLEVEAPETEVEVGLGEEIAESDEGEEEDLIEDTSELGEDDDVSEVIDKVEDEER